MKTGYSQISETLSSNTLFHFTRSLDNLKSILSAGLKISYVPEELPGIEQLYFAPMVCFCDIPLGQIKTHLQHYGDYGIGIHKNICKKVRINPVFYMRNKTMLESLFPGNKINHVAISHVKRYRGRGFCGGKVAERLKFYDEREWRYVETNRFQLVSTWEEAVNQCKTRNIHNQSYLELSERLIEYLIVKNSTERNLMIDFIANNSKWTPLERNLLLTKLITATRIRKDF